MFALLLRTLFFSLVIKENEAQGKWDQYQTNDCSVVLLEQLLFNLIILDTIIDLVSSCVYLAYCLSLRTFTLC